MDNVTCRVYGVEPRAVRTQRFFIPNLMQASPLAPPSGFDFENRTLILSTTPCCSAVQRFMKIHQAVYG